jgi:Membrane bound beta barrel domain (DUF5777)
MENLSKNINSGIITVIFCFYLLFSLSFHAMGQDNGQEKQDKKEKKVDKPVRSPFESNYFIESQTTVVPGKRTLEFIILHRFGSLNSGSFDLFGIYAPSNIRLGISYTPFKRLQIGFGTTKNKLVQDLNWKWAILEQTRSGKIPIAITYYGNVAIEAGSKDNFEKSAHRFTYFNQIMFSRKFGKRFTAQISGSYAHFNVVDSLMKNNNFAVGVLARYKISDQASIIVEYDQPLTITDSFAVKPNLSIGVEIATSSHAFQIFLTTYNGIVYQYNQVYNGNDFTKRGIRLGFNITRLWSY